MSRRAITILGPTATGKTKVAVLLAQQLDGEIVSADSRQIYRLMDIGTGKDLAEYQIAGIKIPFHLIDIEEPGVEYNIFRYQQEAKKALDEIENRGKQSIICGGSGLYIETLLNGYKLFPVPENPKLRAELTSLSDEVLIQRLAALRHLHNHTDTEERTRLLRAIEIEDYYKLHPKLDAIAQPISSVVFGLCGDRDLIRSRITHRLHERLEQGLIQEVQNLLDRGVPSQQLIRYGLEYKFITQFLQANLSYEDMVQKLNIAIHQFSKRQMTWFRKMERAGCSILWFDIATPPEIIVEQMRESIDNEK